MGTDACWNLNLEEIHDVLVTIAKEAGEMITGAKPVVGGVGSKKNCTLTPPPPYFSSPPRLVS
jgi:hypothetical protein